MLLNVNVGVLGHVDAGKSSLAKALSTVASTAAFDKSPQSKARGITLDLGFSAFMLPQPPAHFGGAYEAVQVTLVDCPGHASLIRTIIGGAQIIDVMLLVVDATKGIQTQTAECLVIGEITCENLVVVLNKVDLFADPQTRAAKIDKMTKGLQKTLSTTRFANAPIVPVSGNVGGKEDGGETVGLDVLLDTLGKTIPVPKRSPEGDFLFAVDHCFAIKGQGTVITGTVLKGSATIGDVIELPMMQLQRKIKSMQMFHKPVQRISQGDRAGICITQLDASSLERGIVSTPASVPIITGAIARVTKIRFFKWSCPSRTKFHVTIGHETVMCTAIFFDAPSADRTTTFDFGKIMPWQDELIAVAASVDVTQYQWALLEFDHAIPCPSGTAIIASRLDVDQNTSSCRLAFHGLMSDVVFSNDAQRDAVVPKLRVFKVKERSGVVDRIADETTVIGRGLFKKESKIELYAGMKVDVGGAEGEIASSFGQSGKFRVAFRGGVPEALRTHPRLAPSSSRKGKGKDKGKEAAADDNAESSSSSSDATLPQIILRFNRFVFDKTKKMVQ